MSVAVVISQVLPSPADSRVKAREAKGLYIPSLDGIRAVAVTIVFAAHAGLDKIVPGGFGVTVFFFLSGFLITSLLRHEHARTGGINLRKFYLRRMLRIWPPMYITLGVVGTLCALGVFGLAKPQLEPLLFQVFHLANYHQIFGQGQSMPGTGILWSLAVEEHFYLIWPVFFAFLFGRVSLARLGIVLAVACVAVLAWRCALVWWWHADEWRTYAATDTRIDSIMYGCILALCCNPCMDRFGKPSGWRMYAILVLSSLLLLATFAIRLPAFRETFRYSLQGLALLPLFYIAVSRPDWGVFRWLNWRAVRFVGSLSYSIYLSHFFVLSVLSTGLRNQPSWVIAVIAAIITLLFALAMHVVIERPLAVFRRQLHA